MERRRDFGLILLAVETLVPPVSETSTTKMGYHAGLGDTFIHFGDQCISEEPGVRLAMPDS